jgi:hypothetical protein
MSKVSTQFTMSLDGFIAGPAGDVEHLFHTLEYLGMLDGFGVAHLRFRVVKQSRKPYLPARALRRTQCALIQEPTCANSSWPNSSRSTA